MTEPARTCIELYEFSYFDVVRKRWIRARYRASREEIAQRYKQFKLEGAPEVREAGGGLTAGHLARGPPLK